MLQNTFEGSLRETEKQLDEQIDGQRESNKFLYLIFGGYNMTLSIQAMNDSLLLVELKEVDINKAAKCDSWIDQQANLTLLVLKLGYSRITRSIPMLLMPRLFASSGHQQQWNWWLVSMQWPVLVFCGEQFQIQLPVPSRCWDMIENIDAFLCFLK